METRQMPVTGEFRLARPETLDELASLLAKYGDGAAILAGGTDLLVKLRSGKVIPRVVIDLKQIRALSAEIIEDEASLLIGCLALLSDIIADERVRTFFPVLAEAASTVGSVQIRNRATLAGNICNASPAADTVPALLVHEAVVELAGADGSRSLPLKELFVGPGKTALKKGEIVTAVRLPKPKEAYGSAFQRLTRRRGVDLATINVACLVQASGKVRFAFGAVGPTPIVVDAPDGRLADPSLGNQDRENLIAPLIEKAHPISDVRASTDYRAAMLLVYSRRTLEEALRRLSNNNRGA